MQVKEFERQCGEVREWDRVLVRNGQQVCPEHSTPYLTQITTIHRQALELQQTSSSIDQALDYFESQNKSLDSLLTHYEREIESFNTDPARPLTSKSPSDVEREKTYAMAEDLNKQLDDISRNLASMIEEVNRLSTRHAPSRQEKKEPNAKEAADGVDSNVDAVDQLSAILGAHLRALGTIESGSGKLEGKVKELEGRMGSVSLSRSGRR